MKLIKYISPFIFLFLLSSCWAQSPAINFNLEVIDEVGNPIPNAETSAFLREGKKTIIQEGTTNNKGIVKVEGNSMFPGANCDVNKQGYYKTYGYSGKLNKLNKALNRWEPWGSTVKTLLRKIKNPTAMYAQKTIPMKFPALEQKIGFDLELGDWVAPYGKGVIKDFIFIFQAESPKGNKAHDPYKVSFDLSFSNKLDGIQPYIPDKVNRSSFNWPYEAPTENFSPNLNKFYSYNLEGLYQRKSNIFKFEFGSNTQLGYIFRVRTKVDKNGKLISAKYGKIEGDFDLYLKSINFTYYYNPSGTKSLEFDVNKNLFNWTDQDHERINLLKP